MGFREFIEDYENQAWNLINRMKKWKSSPNEPNPGQSLLGFNYGEEADLATVIAGVKPACFLGMGTTSPLMEKLIEIAKRQNFSVEDFNNSKVIGKPEVVKQIQNLLLKKKSGEIDLQDKAQEAFYHQTLGRLLGYPRKSINNFINQTGRWSQPNPTTNPPFQYSKWHQMNFGTKVPA